MATSTAQSIATVFVYDYELGPDGKPLVGKRVRLTLAYDQAVTIAPNPTVNIDQVPVYSAITDGNGFWQVAVVPNNRLTPANTTYSGSVEGGRSFQISATDVAIPAVGWQSSAILVSAPAALVPAGQTVGTLTVSGNLTVQGTTTLTGGLSIASLTVTGASALQGDVTLSTRLLFGPATGKIVGGTVGLSLRNNADTQDNVLVSDAGNVSVRGTFGVTGATTLTGALTANATSSLVGDATLGARLLFSAAASKLVPGGTSFSIRNNADTLDNVLVSNAGVVTLRAQLVIGAGGAAITGATSVTGNLTHTTAYKLRAFASGTTSLTSGTWGKMALNTVSGTGGYDLDADFNTGTNTWTCRVPGYYAVMAAIQHAATSGRVGARLNKNAGTIIATALIPAHASGNVQAQVNDEQFFAVSDTLILEGFQESGAPANANAGSNSSYLAMHYLSS